jgi:hypothetical protein
MGLRANHRHGPQTPKFNNSTLTWRDMHISKILPDIEQSKPVGTRLNTSRRLFGLLMPAIAE